MRGNPNEGREDGAILLLALIFVLIVTIAIFGLVTFGGVGIKNAANLKGQRSLEYAADGATAAAVQAVRYSYFTFNNPQPVDCLPDGAVLTIPSTTASMTINNDQVTVDCILGPQPTPPVAQFTRVVTFYACPQSVAPCNGNNSVVIATIDFEDVNSSGVGQCSATNTSTCGIGEVVGNWVVQTANS